VVAAVAAAEQLRQSKSAQVRLLMLERAALAEPVVVALTILPQVAENNHSLPIFLIFLINHFRNETCKIILPLRALCLYMNIYIYL
jgi:hypothetical protein